jgi:CubicO group peptidase (beta-lactamase class C family)
MIGPLAPPWLPAQATMIRTLLRAIRPIQLAGALLLAASSLQAQTPWPTTRWATATPREVGINAAVLDSIDAEIRSGRHGYVDRLLVIRHGRLAYDRRYAQDYDRAYGDSARTGEVLRSHDRTGPYNYFSSWWHPYYRRGDLHTLQSVTKTITSIVIGVAATRGEFPSLDTPVLSFFDTAGIANLDDRKRRMTIRHLLTMTAGMDWHEDRPYTDTANTTVGLERSYDWIKFTLDRPMSDEPGARWVYNSGASQLLAAIFYRATGRDVEEYAARHLFAPLGIRDWHWKRTPAGLADTEGGLYLASEDVAKLWYLFVQGGKWEGMQVVSADWVRASLAPAIDVDGRPGGASYGYKWWLYPNPTAPDRMMWAGSGFGGQSPIVVPEDGLIVVMNAWNLFPGRPTLPVGATMRRILNSIDRSR